MTTRATRAATGAAIGYVEPDAADHGKPLVFPTFEHAVFAVDCARWQLGATGPVAVADIEVARCTERIAALAYRFAGDEWQCIGFKLPAPVAGAFPFGWYEDRARELLDTALTGKH